MCYMPFWNALRSLIGLFPIQNMEGRGLKKPCIFLRCIPKVCKKQVHTIFQFCLNCKVFLLVWTKSQLWLRSKYWMVIKLFLHLHRQGQNLHSTNQGGDTFCAKNGTSKNPSSNLLLSGGLQLRNHEWLFPPKNQILLFSTKSQRRTGKWWEGCREPCLGGRTQFQMLQPCPGNC